MMDFEKRTAQMKPAHDGVYRLDAGDFLGVADRVDDPRMGAA